MSTGYFSHTLQNLSDYKNDLESIKGLSAKASEIKKDAVALIAANSTYMNHLQNELQASCKLMLSDLQKALTVVNDNNIKGINLIKDTNKRAMEFNKKTEDAIVYNGNLKTKALGFSNELHLVLAELENKVHKLSAEEQKAKDKADKYKKEKYYFLALGPFGVAGLATATSLFATWNSKAKKASDKVNKVRREIAQVRKFQSQLNELQESFAISIELISNSKNALVLLTGDINTILSNSTVSGLTNEVLIVYLKASITQLEIIQTDIA